MMRCPSGANFDPAAASAGTTLGCSSTEWAELEMKNAYLMAEVEEAQAALARKYQEAQEAIDRAEKAEEELVSLRLETQAATQRASKAEEEASAAAKRASTAEEEASTLRSELLVARSALQASNEARQQMESSALSVAADLAAKASHVAGERTALQQQQLVNLEAQRSSEEQLLAILQQQRLSLQAEVAGVKVELDGAKSQLSTVEAELAALGAVQTARREQALEAIITCARRELAQLGDGLDDGLVPLNEQLSGIQAGASAIGDSLEAVMGRAAESNAHALDKASCCTQSAITALGDITQCAANLSEGAEQTMCDAAKQLKSLERLGGERVFEDLTAGVASYPSGLRKPSQRTRVALARDKENAPQMTATKLEGHELPQRMLATGVA